MYRYIQVNDVHLSDKPPRWRKDSYTDEVLEKLQWVAHQGPLQRAQAILCTGDLFHIPTPSRNSHALVRRVMEVISSVPTLDWLIVPGNHDVGSMADSTFSRSPLATLAVLPNVHILDGIYEAQPGVKFLGVPWDHNLTTEAIAKACWNAANLGHRIQVIAIHGAVARESNPFYSTLHPETFGGYAQVISHGHLHAPETPYKAAGAVVVNPGSLSRGSLTSTDLGRTPQVAVVTVTEGVAVEMLPVPCRPAQEVFRVESALRERQESEAVTTFLTALASLQPSSEGAIDVHSEIDRLAAGDSALAQLCKELVA